MLHPGVFVDYGWRFGGRVLSQLVQVFCTVTLLVLSTSLLFAQGALTLSSVTAPAGGTATLNVTLVSPADSRPAGLQWTLAYSPTNIVSISAIAGASANAAAKSINCAASSGSYVCLLIGLNTNVIQDGVVAVVSVRIASGVASTAINAIDTLGVSAGGGPLPMNGVGVIVTVAPPPPPTLSALSCAPASLNSGGSSTCTVTVSNAGGAAVALSDNVASLTVPPSVTVGAGSTTGTFTATAGTITSNQTAAVTATSSGSSLTTSISLVAPPPVQIPVFNTGVASTGVLLADGAVDSHYKLVASSDPNFAGPNAVTVYSNAFPIPPWTANGPNSKWIGPRADAGVGNSPGTYTYRTTFDLTGLNVVTARLAGQWASDNEGVMKLNGNTVSTSSEASFTGWVPFTINTGFVAGINTLDLVVTIGPPDANPTRLRVEIAGTATALSAPAVVLSQASRTPSNVATEGTFARTKTPFSGAAGSLSSNTLPSSAPITGIRPTSVACSPIKIQAGDSLTCKGRLSTSNIPEIVQLAVWSDSPNLKTP